MFNLPVKFSILVEPYEALSPQAFLELSPWECLSRFKQCLPERSRNTLEFALPDEAILLMLEHEFEVPVSRRQLVFNKPYLDAQSWQFSHGFQELPQYPEFNEIIESLTETMWKQTLPFSTTVTTLEDRISLRRELHTLLMLYLVKFGQSDLWHALQVLKMGGGLKHFFNLVVTDALYKADAAKVLFGRESEYYHLWLEKQYEFLRYAHQVETLQRQQIA